jgi:hypothetical protein
MSVCCECCVLSGRGLCDELITLPDESYRLWCVVVCDQETWRMRRPWPALGRSATENKLISMSIFDILQIPSGSVQICSAWIAPCYKSSLRASADCNVTVVKILTQYSRQLSKSIRRYEQRLPYTIKNRDFLRYLTLLRPVVSIGTTWYNIKKLCILPTKCMWFVWFLQYNTLAAVHNINRLVLVMRTNCVVNLMFIGPCIILIVE